MTHQKQYLLSHLLALLGLMMLLGAGGIWAQQTRAEAIKSQQIALAEVTYAPPTWAPVNLSPTVSATPQSVELPTTVPSPTAPIVSSPTVQQRAQRTIPIRRTKSPLPTPTQRASASIPPTLPSETPSQRATLPSLTPSQRATSTQQAYLAAPSPTPTSDPFPPAKSVPSRLFAPSIDLESNVVEMGWQVKSDSYGNPYSEWLVPEFAAGWHKNSSLPGHGGNTVLSAHNNVSGEVFRDLANLAAGDQVELEADGIRYRYVVEETYIVKEEGESLDVRRQNNRFIEPTPDERLTLVSCWPYETNSHRVIVIARPLPSPTQSDIASPAQRPTAK